jgi:hypothetical protein
MRADLPDMAESGLDDVRLGSPLAEQANVASMARWPLAFYRMG